MTRLPPELTPWAAWLSLFPPDLAPALGQLVLGLQPLVGKLTTATPERGAEPANIGDIVRRGNYERLLMTEWVYADAEPNEFLRRAGSGELLFHGPEPAARQRPLRSMVVFDAGPTQLGEPRLAHLALFILLARRAEQARAQFSWGVWQQPGVLHEDAGRDGLLRLIKSRTLRAAPADAGQQWETAMAAAPTDCWLVGTASAERLAQASNRVAIRRALVGDHLHVDLHQRRDHRALRLALPDTSTVVRLLRKPFAPAAPLGVIHHRDSRASRAQAPRFSSGGNWLAVPQLGGGAMVYPVPGSALSKPGKHRVQTAPAQGTIIAAGVFKRNLAHLAAAGDKLRFVGFPGPLFSHQRTVCERPAHADFLAPPGMAQWLPAFYLLSRDPARPRERVAVLDKKQRLVCWQATATSKNKTRPDIVFTHLAEQVIGTHQGSDAIDFACSEGDGVQLYSLRSNQASPIKQMYIAEKGRRLLYGELQGWHPTHGGMLLAIERSATGWSVGSNNKREMMEIDDGATVLGVAIGKQNPNPGLIVLHPGRRRIELRVHQARYELATSPEEIQQASMDARSGRVAWITAKTATVVIKALGDDLPLLQISNDGGPDEP